jgi:site-specific DNA-methyltransferase (adenine-specific)
LILDNSNEGDIVFDPCCGSGSHLLIAKNHDRKWLGCELSAEWFKVASNRLNKISIFDDFE